MNTEKEWFEDEERIKKALTNAALAANKEQRAVMGIEEAKNESSPFWWKYLSYYKELNHMVFEEDIPALLEEQQQRDWNEFKALIDTHMMKSGMRRDIDALRGVREDIEDKLSSLE